MADVAFAESQCGLVNGHGPGLSAGEVAFDLVLGGITATVVDGLRNTINFSDCVQSSSTVMSDGKAQVASLEIIATDLPPPGAAGSAAKSADQVTGWGTLQRALNDRKSADTPAMFRTLCQTGDASACMMADALEPHVKLIPSH